MPSSLAILPIMIPLAGAAVAVLVCKRRKWQAPVALGSIVASTVSCFVLLWQVWRGGEPLVFQVGAWPAPFGITIVADLLGATMAVMSQVVMSCGILYALGSKDTCVRYHFFLPLFLTLATGLTGAMLTGDLFNMFVFIEVMVVSGAALTAISDDKLGTEAAYKYFYMSQLASAFLLLAVGCLYVSFGTLNLADLAQRIAADPRAPLLPMALVLLLATFMVKSAVVPFHFWQPDFHTAAPVPVHAVLSSVVVKIGVYGFMRMTNLLFVEQAEAIRLTLIAMGAAGLILGGLGAAGTYDAKRMLAYSTLGQIGFIIMALGWGTAWGLAAAIIHSVNHALIKSAMLMLAGAVGSRAPIKTAAFKVIRGLGRFLPYNGVLFLLGGMALIGIPPLNGFVSKLTLFRGGIDAAAYGSLAVFAVGSLITFLYTTRAFMRIWWERPEAGVQVKPKGDRLIAPTILIGLCLLLGVWAEPLVRLAQDTTEWLGRPESYIEAVLNNEQSR
jgi:multicomponent Na+:H+ antiporter subunit D